MSIVAALEFKQMQFSRDKPSKQDPVTETRFRTLIRRRSRRPATHASRHVCRAVGNAAGSQRPCDRTDAGFLPKNRRIRKAGLDN